MKVNRFVGIAVAVVLSLRALSAEAQEETPQPPAAEPAPASAQAEPDGQPSPAAPQPSEAEPRAATPDAWAPEGASLPAAAPEAEPRGPAPLSPEAIVSEAVGALAGEEPVEQGESAPATTPAPGLPRVPRERAPAPTRHAPRKLGSAPPLVVWAAAGLGDAFGPARCEQAGLAGIEPAIHIASTLKHSVEVAGVGVAPAGALSDHPLLAYAAAHEPERLAAWLAAAGLSVIAVGVQDLTGPLLRFPQLSDALQRHGITVVASNLQCGAAEFCRTWATAEKPLPSVTRGGQRYVLLSLLPDDVAMRVEAAGGQPLTVRPVSEALVTRTAEAYAAGAAVVIASIDHGPDATAAARVADLLAELPHKPRPELLLSPSSGENMLFMRPLDVQPAVVGTRRGVLTGVRIAKFLGGRDADVLARSVRLYDWDDGLAAELGELGAAYCRDSKQVLPGGTLEVPLAYEGLVPLAAASARELADADIALVDPLVFEPSFRRPGGAELQRGELARAVLLDAPLVTANVPLEWLAQLSKSQNDLRPLMLTNYKVDGKEPLVAGRAPVVGALYSVVTTSVLARSDRLPGGPSWKPVDEANATLRGALLNHLSQPSRTDPRIRVEDPAFGTQWVLRMDGQLIYNLTETYNPRGDKAYDEPALKVNDSKQFGLRYVLNLDADAPKFLFENAFNISFDRNFTTKTTAQDLSFLQTSYTYRGLWPDPLFYPHPFAEGYVETQLTEIGSYWLLRPKLGLRTMFSRVASLKVFGGAQYNSRLDELKPGLGAELQLKPWAIATSSGNMLLEGNVSYFWSSPGSDDQHALRAQLIASYQLVGPLQLTLTALGALRKDRGNDYGRGVGVQAGVRLRFVSRDVTD